MRHLNTIFLALFAHTLLAQVTFSNQTNLLSSPTDFSSGVAVGVADMNGDGLDDIVRLKGGKTLNIQYQTAPDQLFSNYDYGGFQGIEWAMVLGDVNNDGLNDIFVGGSYNGAKMLTNNTIGGYSITTLPNSSGTLAGLFVQGSNFADINNDGWLDAFACHDDGEARIWGNDGTGQFASADEWIDMATIPASDNSGNYGSTWTDFDNDGDLDLYIAKCRQGVTDETDPRRINALFVNDGQNNYTEQAAEHGLKIQWQSWTADFQDIDNDGDMDALVTNHDYPLMLLENDGRGYFTDIAVAAGVDVTGNFIQGIMRDFDNDGFVDILTVGNFSSSTLATHLFHNNGDQTFTQLSSPFGSASIGSVAVGDLNNDGQLDAYATYSTNFNTPTANADKLWMNTTANGNNHFAVNLQGTASNRNGAGARVEIHGEWGIQIREVHSGESYGIQNSLTQYFGLGSSTTVEYVVVRWPSGTVDVVKNPEINASLTIVEGSTCALPSFAIGASGPTTLCPGSSLTLAAPAGYDYLWNNGMVGQSITITTPGNYSLVAIDSQGCAAVSEILPVTIVGDEIPSLTLEGEEEICEGGFVVLTSSPATSYAWSNGETTQSITVTQTGDFAVTVQGQCAAFSSETIHIEVFPALAPSATNVEIPAPGTATLEATGDNLFWYDSPTATTPLFNGPSFVTPSLTQDAVFYVEDQHAYGGGNYSTGMLAPQGSNIYSSDSYNGQNIFEVYQPMRLKQVTVSTDKPGVRRIELILPTDEVVANMEVDLAVGDSTLDLNFDIQPGVYRLTTNNNINLASLGTNGPRLTRSAQGVSYPYNVTDLMSITGSDNGSGFYYYFFDWKVEAIPTICTSERIPVEVTVGPSASGEVLPFGKMSVQPNPSDGIFTLNLEPAQTGMASIQVTDLTGRLVLQEKFETVAHFAQQRKIDLTAMPAGIYVLKINSGDQSAIAKLVVE